MRKLILGLLAMVVAFTVNAQEDENLAVKYAATITADELKEHLFELADDKYEGRETGKEGQKLAANYIAKFFRNLGIKPCVDGSYYQKFPLKKVSTTQSTMAINGQKLDFIKDFYFFSGFPTGKIEANEILYLGYGIDSEDYSDYDGINVKGKILLMEMGEPKNSKGIYHVTGTKEPSEYSGDFRYKRDLAQSKGAKAVIMINPEYDTYISRIKYYLESPRLMLDDDTPGKQDALPCFFVGKRVAMSVLGGKKKYSKRLKCIQKKKKNKSEAVTAKCEIDARKAEEQVYSENVLAFIEGSDPELKSEVVVVTAHYDHVGVTDGEVYNGADDDGSGTVSALEIAEAFMTAVEDGNGPRRSVLVMTVSGEEKGLLGSEYYVNNPVFPLENTVCDLNIDMIGRVDTAHYNNFNYVYLIGSDRLSTDLHKISEDVNATYTNLDLDYTFNDPKDPNRFYYRSDHYNFAKNNIPVIFYFSGVHEDYHQPGDDPDKIMYEKMSIIAKLVFHTAWEVANTDERLKVDVLEQN